jgi:hypothetical protein
MRAYLYRGIYHLILATQWLLVPPMNAILGKIMKKIAYLTAQIHP